MPTPSSPDLRPAPAAAATGAAPPRRSRRVLRVVIALVLLLAVVQVGLSVRRVLRARARQEAAEAWTPARKNRFHDRCADEAIRMLPPRVVEAGSRDAYCTCVTEGVAAAFPSHAQGVRAFELERTGPDAQQVADVVARCAAPAR